jgi:hypothetical protein
MPTKMRALPQAGGALLNATLPRRRVVASDSSRSIHRIA